MSDFLKNLQDKPYATRVRILWMTVGVVGAVLVVIFVMNIKGAVKNSSGLPSITQPTSSNARAAQTDLKLVSVERVERQGQSLKIYFNINNTTSDILNLPAAADITLTVDGQALQPTQTLDRQAQPFVQKVLSHTQNFGVLSFDSSSGNSGQLLFDQMFFESAPDQLFSQSLDLDFDKLKNTETLKH